MEKGKDKAPVILLRKPHNCIYKVMRNLVPLKELIPMCNRKRVAFCSLFQAAKLYTFDPAHFQCKICYINTVYIKKELTIIIDQFLQRTVHRITTTGLERLFSCD